MRKTVNIDCSKEEALTIWDSFKISTTIIYDCCARCGSTDDLATHHIDGDKRNNDLSNHMCVCRACHFYIHHYELGVRYLSVPFCPVPTTPLRYKYKPPYWKKFL